MIRSFAVLSLVLGVAALGAACSSSASDSLALCAKASACIGNTTAKFGASCQILDAYAHLDSSLLGTDDKVTAAALECVNAASDCAAVRACVTASAAQAAVCQGGSQHRCAGDVLVSCDTQGSTPPFIDDCGAAGLVCVESGTGAACGTASCDPQTTAPKCDGDMLVACDGSGALQAANCRLHTDVSCSTDGSGLSCHTHVAETCGVVDGEAKCVGAGDACDEATFAEKCDGSTIVTCTGGKVARLDCTTLDPNTTCKAQNGSLGCAGVGTECDDKTPETCQDGVITFCLWGKKTTVDCKSYDFSGCTTNTQGGASCTP